MKNNVLIYICIVLFALCSCKKSEPDTDITVDANNIEYITNEETFAMALAMSLQNNPELSSFILNEASKKFDGDDNFLIVPAIDTPSTKGSMSLRGLMRKPAIITKSAGNNSIDLDQILDRIETESPLLQIYVMNRECLNQTEELKVVYIPDDFNESTTTAVPCYDYHGNMTMIPTNDEHKGETMIVVSRNERTTAVKKNNRDTFNPFDGTESIYRGTVYDYYLTENINATLSGIESSYSIDDLIIPEELKNSPRYKMGKTRDYIYKVRPKSKSAWNKMEDPFLGDPELVADVVYGKYFGGILGSEVIRKTLPTGYKNRLNIQWKTQDIEVMQWNLKENGKSMKYVWTESDGGNIIDISIPVSISFLDNKILSSNITIGIGKKDERAGEALVYYSDENEHMYDTGYVLFTIKYRSI